MATEPQSPVIGTLPAGAAGNKAANSPPSKWSLFANFLRLGATAFGGPAMVAYIRELAVIKKGWLTEGCFQDGVALCQSIPGATAMQTAAYVGLRAGGVLGAVATYVAFGLPAFVLMVVLAELYGRGQEIAAVVSAFRGLQVIVIALIANATFTFGKNSIKNWKDALIAVGAAVALGARCNPLFVIGAAALLGMLLYRADDLPKPAPTETARACGAGPIYAALALLALLAGGLALLYQFDEKLFGLSALMLKVDALAFGGGYASVPLMLNEVVEVRGWMDARTFTDGIALGQVTPGPIVITATFVGCRLAGLAGALLATVAIFSPSFVLVLLTVPYLDRLRQSRLFRAALRGALASFTGLLLAATVRLGTAVPWTIAAVALAVAALVALRLRVNIFWVVLAGAALALLLF